MTHFSPISGFPNSPVETAARIWNALPPGDWATWAGAAGSVIVAFVAILPIWRARRAHKARGKLVAAYLLTPIGSARTRMKKSVAALTEFSNYPPTCDAATFRNSLAQLRLLCEETPGHLAAFKIEDVAYLSPNIGRVLALAMGSSNSVLDPIRRALGAYDAMQKLTNAEQIAEHRTKLSLLVKKLPDKLELAADMLDVFMQVVLKQKKEKAAIKEIASKSAKVAAEG